MYQQKGFTLIEIALALVIIGLLLTGLFKGLESQVTNAKLAETENILTETKKALLLYVTTEGHLPCPDTDNDGRENRGGNGQCTRDYGTIPYLDLQGIGQKDAYQQALLYSVNRRTDRNNVNNNGNINDCPITTGGNASACYFNQNSTLGSPRFNLSTPPTGTNTGAGNLSVCGQISQNQCNASLNPKVAQYVPAVIVSFGHNGAQTWTNCNNASNAERENCDHDAYFVQKTFANNTTDANKKYDDQLTWISALEIKKAFMESGNPL